MTPHRLSARWSITRHSQPAEADRADDGGEGVEEHGGWTQPTGVRFPGTMDQ
ncbi:hypothetical protein SEA_LTON_28 [Gordonia phage Lton]|nr:hypothetical protein SEA_LTON_28 [Gordonia phage Lton]